MGKRWRITVAAVPGDSNIDARLARSIANVKCDRAQRRQRRSL
jgi:hypothetical protein